jgi:hypothetical protein
MPFVADLLQTLTGATTTFRQGRRTIPVASPTAALRCYLVRAMTSPSWVNAVSQQSFVPMLIWLIERTYSHTLVKTKFCLAPTDIGS